MAMDLSARFTADGSQLVAEAGKSADAVEGIGESSRKAAGGAKELEDATAGAAGAADRLSRGSKELATRQGEAMRATAGAAAASNNKSAADIKAEAAAVRLATAEARLGAALNNEERSAAAAALAALKLEQAQGRLGQSLNNGTKSSNAQQFAIRNLGQQFGDFATQVSLGGGVARAFASQAGQMGYALSDFGGKLGQVGKFLVGPWGIALTVAATLAAPFIGKLFEAGETAEQMRDKLDKAAQSADSFGNAQSILGKAIDLTTGKFKTQNEVLIRTIELQGRALAIAGKVAEKQARNELLAQGTATSFGPLNVKSGLAAAALIASGVPSTGTVATDPALAAITNGIATNRITMKEANDRLDQLRASGKITEEVFNKAALSVIKLGTALNDQEAGKAIGSAANGGKLDPRLVPYEKPKKGPKGPSAETLARRAAALAEFGNDTASKLAGIREGFDDTPARVREVNKQLRDLDDLIDDLTRRKPPGFEKLVADAKALKPLVQDSLGKPFADYIDQQRESLAVQQLLTAGKVDEANALRTIQQLQRSMGPLTDEQKAAVLGTVQAMRAEARALDDLRSRNAKYLEALGGIKTIVEDATQAFARGDLGQIIKSPGKLLDVFQTLNGRALFDKVFGGLFQELEDQVNGTSTVRDASDRMAGAVDKASASILKLGQAADRAAGGLGQAAGGGSMTDPATGDIVVTGQRPSLTSDPRGFITGALSKVGEKVAGAFTNPDNAKRIGSSIGKFAGKGLEGAATGAIVSGIGNSLGLKLNSTGSQIGGAIGSFLPIPGGSVIGSIAGGLIGGLFGKKKDYVTANLTGQGDPTVNYNNNNFRGANAAKDGLAGAVQEGISNIAQQLGGALGRYNVSIGTYDGDYRVSTSGQTGELSYGKKNKSKSTLYDFGDDQAAAISFAIADAVKDGAVTGLSTAVQKAIASSSDINKGLAEALKVRQLEILIGGLGSSLKAQFQAFDSEASERVRLAKAYGLDLLAVERINGEERAKLVDDTLKSRIGSLTDFLRQTQYGDLAEGSASDKRAALSARIATVQADAQAGKDGAADELAQLLAQKLALTRDAYGTAGDAYSGDRASSISTAQQVIKMETDRVNTAAGVTAAQTAALGVIATKTDESNDLIARMIAEQKRTNSLLSSGGGSPVANVNTVSTRRATSLAYV